MTKNNVRFGDNRDGKKMITGAARRNSIMLAWVNVPLVVPSQAAEGSASATGIFLAGLQSALGDIEEAASSSAGLNYAILPSSWSPLAALVRRSSLC